MTRATISLQSDNYAGAFSLARQLLNQLWLDGSLPFMRTRLVEHLRPGVSLTLDGGPAPWRSVSESPYRGRREEVFQQAADGTWALAAGSEGRSAHFTVAAAAEALADELIARLTDGISDPPTPDLSSLLVRFWWLAPNGPARDERVISVTQWDGIGGNYAASVRGPLGKLMAIRPGEIRGRVILLHGKPGTGKTTLLRALGSAWRDWCDTAYILDPEQALNSGTYLMQALLDGNADRWRLIVMEDCGEMFTADARAHTGQALSRLLNLADGMLGHGANLIFALTTNEPVAALHQAVIRPGRALASLEIPELPEDEAAAWLGFPVPDGTERTLASLYALRDERLRVLAADAEAEILTGLYL